MRSSKSRVRRRFGKLSTRVRRRRQDLSSRLGPVRPDSEPARVCCALSRRKVSTRRERNRPTITSRITNANGSPMITVALCKARSEERRVGKEGRSHGGREEQSEKN